MTLTFAWAVEAEVPNLAELRIAVAERLTRELSHGH